VTQAIADLRLQYIKFPVTEQEQSAVKQMFYSIARFPRVVGALDCTHVKIKSPGKVIFYKYCNGPNRFDKLRILILK
jgi:hypothetical protein